VKFRTEILTPKVKVVSVESRDQIWRTPGLHHSRLMFTYLSFNQVLKVSRCQIGQIFRISTVRYPEGPWRMRRHGPVIVHCTDSEDFPQIVANCRVISADSKHWCLVIIRFHWSRFSGHQSWLHTLLLALFTPLHLLPSRDGRN